MLVTLVQEDGTLNGEVFTDGQRVNYHIQGAPMAEDPDNPGMGTCTLPEGSDSGILEKVEEAAHRADLASNRTLDHQHKAEAAATKAEAAAARAEEAATAQE